MGDYRIRSDFRVRCRKFVRPTIFTIFGLLCARGAFWAPLDVEKMKLEHTFVALDGSSISINRATVNGTVAATETKDSILGRNDSVEALAFDALSGPHRILIGIFSTDTDKDLSRRKLIRKTYLSMFKILKETGLYEGRFDRICPLSDLLKNEKEAAARMQECSLVYTFVVGVTDPTNSSMPTELLKDPATDKTISYTLDHSGKAAKDSISSTPLEDDVTYLNIRENMNEGKSMTWFKYGSSILPSSLGIDLIGKVDMDTVVYPRGFLEDLNNQMDKRGISRPAASVYGGLRQVGTESYMQGGFYLLSRDLAQYITSEACPRAEIIEQEIKERGYRAEDREVGRFVDSKGNSTSTVGHSATSSEKPRSLPDQVRRIFLNSHTSAFHHWRHKSRTNFRVEWKDGLAKDVSKLRYRELKQKYNETAGCPPSEENLREEKAWFDKRPNMKQAKHQFSKLLSSSCKQKAS